MKKLIVLTLGLFATIFASAQVKQYDYEVAEFDSITVGNEFDLSVVYGEKFGIILTVDEPLKDYVNFNVKGGTLSIQLDEKSIPSDIKKMYKGKSNPTPTYRVLLTTPDAIGNVTIKDKAVLSEVRGVATKEKMTVSATDNAQIKAFVIDSKEVEISADKKTNVSLTVNTSKLDASFSGSSNANLTCGVRSGVFAVSGASKLVLHGEVQTLDFTAKGTSNSVLNGNCDNALFSCSGSSEVNALNLSTLNANVSMTGTCTLQEAASESLKVELSSGSTLIFNNRPAVEVVNIKSASMLRYGSSKK